MSYAKISYPELTLIQDKEYILNIYLNYLKQLKTVKKKTIHYINIIINYIGMLTFTGCDMCKLCQWIYSYSELIRHDGSSFCRCCFKTTEDERWAEGVLE